MKGSCYLRHLFVYALWETGTFLVAQMVKNLPAMQETRVWSLGQEDPLDKGMATHSSIVTWSTLWTEELGGLQSMGLQRVGHDWATNTFISLFKKHFFFNFIYLFIFGQSIQHARPNSPTRGQTGAPSVKVQSSNHWTAREFPSYISIEKKKVWKAALLF